MRDIVSAQLNRYIAAFPDEAPRLVSLREQLEGDEGDLFSRANMAGHVTSSVLVLNRDCTKVLLIHHLHLNRWLQPGGHVEQDASPWESACREVLEETGVVAEPFGSRWDGDLPFDIDSHPIPAHAKKGEGDHVHHDFLYLGRADDSHSLNPQLAEVAEVQWAPVELLRTLASMRLRRLADRLDDVFA